MEAKMALFGVVILLWSLLEVVTFIVAPENTHQVWSLPLYFVSAIIYFILRIKQP